MAYINTQVVEMDQVTISNHVKELGIENIRKEIIDGLNKRDKTISSKFFYDEKGSKLFEQITKLPEYYPTQTEKELLKEYATELMSELKDIDIVELGSGDCSKISILLNAIQSKNLTDINYIPVDVSHAAIQKSSEELIHRFPNLNIHGLVADFINQIDLIPDENRRMFCFLGSTLGNFDEQMAHNFLKNLSQNMNEGDRFLLGLDLVKPQQVLHDAYNDNQGVTAEFNKNILNVVNEIIQSDFNLDDFEHQAFFNEDKSRIEMHLKAKDNLKITSPFHNQPILIEKNETIHTENSYKFSIDRIKHFEHITGLERQKTFTDSKNWFSLTLFNKP